MAGGSPPKKTISPGSPGAPGTPGAPGSGGCGGRATGTGKAGAGTAGKTAHLYPGPFHSWMMSQAGLNDPRIAAYRALKDRELARESKLFIAEGQHVVTRLLQSRFGTESVLLAERKVAAMQRVVPEGVAIYRVADSLIHQIVGYRFHSGVIAAGKRRPLLTVEALMNSTDERVTLVVCPETNNTEDLGMLIRLAAGVGA